MWTSFPLPNTPRLRVHSIRSFSVIHATLNANCAQSSTMIPITSISSDHRLQNAAIKVTSQHHHHHVPIRSSLLGHSHQIIRSLSSDPHCLTLLPPWAGSRCQIIIVVEGIYSMEGEICKLKEIVAVKKKYKVRHVVLS